jgi:transcriptional regulator with XRE-family HTH domain
MVLMTEQQAMRLREATQELLERRNMTPHGAYLRTGVSREAIAKLLAGRRPSLEVVEQFARAFGEDVNRWRVLCDYAPVEDPRAPLELILDKSKELTYEPDLDTVTFKGFLAGPNVHPEDREALERIARAVLSERRRKQGRN